MSGRAAERSNGRGGPVAQFLGFVAAFAAAGAVAGAVWEWLWDAPSGITYQDEWFLQPAGPDFAFSGTGWYVVVALVAGAITAFALGWWWPRHELVGLAAIVVGSAVAGWVMLQVGHALGPGDPQLLAAGQPDFTAIPSDLTVSSAGAVPRRFRPDSTAMAAFPIGAMIASVYVFAVATGRRRGRGAESRPSRPDHTIETTSAG